MQQIKLFLVAGLFFISGITLLFHTYSNVLPEMTAQHETKVLSEYNQDIMVDTPSVSKIKIDTLIMSVFFSPGVVTLSQEQELKISNILHTMENYRNSSFRLDGYADHTGARSVDNNYISLNRSFAVYKYLIGNGISKDNIYMRSFGFIHDANSNNDSIRKVDISFLTGESDE